MQHQQLTDHGRIQGRVQGVRTPLPTESALFCRRVQFSNQSFPQKRHSFIAQKQNFPQNPRKGTRSLHKTKNIPQKKTCFFATRKDVESYTQMPGKRILALEFSIFTALFAFHPTSYVSPNLSLLVYILTYIIQSRFSPKIKIQ
jgi:hypothetical protein